MLSLAFKRLGGTTTTSILAGASGAWVSGSRLAGEEEDDELANRRPASFLGTPPAPGAHSQAHLVTRQDRPGPLVGLVQLVAAVWLLLEPRLLFGRVVVSETGRLCFGDEFYIVDKDERLEYGPGEKGEELQPNRAWGLEDTRGCPFLQQTSPGPAHGGRRVPAGRDPTAYFSNYFSRTNCRL